MKEKVVYGCVIDKFYNNITKPIKFSKEFYEDDDEDDGFISECGLYSFYKVGYEDFDEIIIFSDKNKDVVKAFILGFKKSRKLIKKSLK